jgi:hypothetical protein
MRARQAPAGANTPAYMPRSVATRTRFTHRLTAASARPHCYRIMKRRSARAWASLVAVIICGCTASTAPVERPAVVAATPSSALTASALAGSPTPAAPTPTTQAAAPPGVKVTARWIVHENVGDASRWLLVAGPVARGTEADPQADADYMIVRAVDEAFARASGLPLRALTIPRFYTLPEPFTVQVTIESEPPGARLYEVVDGGALVPIGTAPVDITFDGTVSDLKASIGGRTWLVQNIPATGVPLRLRAASDTAASGPDATIVPLLTDVDLAALRRPVVGKGPRTLHKHFALPVHEALSPTAKTAIINAVIVIEHP